MVSFPKIFTIGVLAAAVSCVVGGPTIATILGDFGKIDSLVATFSQRVAAFNGNFTTGISVLVASDAIVDGLSKLTTDITAHSTFSGVESKSVVTAETRIGNEMINSLVKLVAKKSVFAKDQYKPVLQQIQKTSKATAALIVALTAESAKADLAALASIDQLLVVTYKNATAAFSPK